MKRLRDTHFVLLGLLMLSVMQNARLNGGLLLVYVVRPALWLLLAYLTGVRFSKQRFLGNLRIASALRSVGTLIAVLQISASVMFGLIEGFGRSPYSFSAMGIILNVWLLVTEVLGMEISRAWLVNKMARRQKPRFIVLVTFLYVSTLVSLRGLLKVTDKIKFIRLFGTSETVSMGMLVYRGLKFRGPR